MRLGIRLGSIRLGCVYVARQRQRRRRLKAIELVERGIKHLSKLVVDVAQFSRRKALEPANVDS